MLYSNQHQKCTDTIISLYFSSGIIQERNNAASNKYSYKQKHIFNAVSLHTGIKIGTSDKCIRDLDDLTTHPLHGLPFPTLVQFLPRPGVDQQVLLARYKIYAGTTHSNFFFLLSYFSGGQEL